MHRRDEVEMLLNEDLGSELSPTGWILFYGLIGAICLMFLCEHSKIICAGFGMVYDKATSCFSLPS